MYKSSIRWNRSEIMIIRPDYVIENDLYNEALEYAENSKKFTLT